MYVSFANRLYPISLPRPKTQAIKPGTPKAYLHRPISQVGTESADSVTNISRNIATLPCNSQTPIGQTPSREPAYSADAVRVTTFPAFRSKFLLTGHRF